MTPSLESLEKSLDKQLRDARPERLEQDAEGRYICPKCGNPKTYKQMDWRYKICGECSDYELDPRRLAEAANAMSAEIEEERKRKVQRKKAAAGQKRRARERKKEETVEDKIQQELASRELARRSLLHYIERTLPNYEAGWVHEDICRRLEKFVRDVEEKKSPRLILAIPPRHGKSQIASVSFPAWLLGRHPEYEFIMASYAVELPLGFSRKVRAQIQSAEYKNLFPNTHLSKESQAAESWRTTKGGGLRASGIGSGITGMGAHCVVPDATIYSRTRGIIPISSVKPNEEIAAYDHSHECAGWTRVVAVAAQRRTKHLIAGSDTGHPVVTTDHRVFVPGRGYVEAGSAQNMPRMRWAESAARRYLPEVPLKSKAVDGRPHMHSMWGYISTPTVRAREVDTAPRNRCEDLLLSRVLRHAQERSSRGLLQASRYLRSLWRDIERLGSEKILLFRLLPLLSPGTSNHSGLQRVVSSSEIPDLSEGRACVSNLRENNSPGDTSFGREYGQQQSDESDLALQNVPQLVSRDPRTCAEDLARIYGFESDYVVDLQTVTENFFCDGVLIHNCLVIDDPVKDSESADSATAQQTVLDWYSSTAYTRLAPGGGCIVIMTRWTDGDLAGTLERQMNEAIKEINLEELDLREALLHTRNSAEQAVIYKRLRDLRKEYDTIDKWEVVSYPAIATHDEYLNRRTGEIVRAEGQPLAIQAYLPLRKKGEALHPERFPEALLMKYKRTLQPRHWSALYQQQPTPDEGSYFTKDMFRIRPTLPDWSTMYRFAAWDLAIGVKTTNDWTVGVVVGLDHDDNLWVLDMIRGRWGDTDKIASLILDTSLRYECVLTGLEKGQLEMAIKPHLDRLMKQRRTYIPLAEGESALKPITDKLVRARTLQGRMQQGTVLFPGDQPWIETIQHELLRFPTGTHDDIVDAMAWAARMVSGHNPPPRLASNQLPKGHVSWRQRVLTLMRANGSEKNFMSR